MRRSLLVKGVAEEYGSKVRNRNLGATLQRSGNGRGKLGRDISKREGK